MVERSFRFDQWCHFFKEDSEFYEFFLRWYREHFQEQLTLFEEKREHCDSFLEQEWLSSKEWDAFFQYCQQEKPLFYTSLFKDLPERDLEEELRLVGLKPTLELATISSEDLEVFSASSVSLLSTCFAQKYELLSVLGQGGMGVVYKALHQELRSFFAVKVIIAGKHAEEATIARFHKEAQICAKLKHPGIVQVVDSGLEHGAHYFVMEWVEGETLEEWALSERYSIRGAVQLIQKTLEALEYAHQQGIIHRDLKPANILVTLQGEPKIADFGLAKEMSSSQELQVTQQGVILGTPAYMPPEQASGEISLLDSRSDIYSMGACLYFLLTKRHVFSADSFRKVLYKIIYEDPEAPSRYQAQIHRDLDTILLKALEKPQSKRYASAKAFAQDLQNFLQGFPILARPAHPVERLQKWVLRNRKGVATVALLFMAFLSFLAFLYWNAQKLKLQQFQIAFQQAQEKKKQALASPPPSKETQLHLLLDALKDLHRAQEAQPSSALNISQEKLAVSKALIPLACSLHNYQLAEYVLQEIDSVSQRDALRKSIETKRDEVKKHHQERLHYWFSELKKRKIKKGIREEALFEISKMGEKEILEELLQKAEEGLSYFLQVQENREVRLEEFYRTVISILGRLAQEEAIPFLKKGLEQMTQKLVVLPLKPREDLDFMLEMVFALHALKAPNVSLFLGELRQTFGRDTFFWERTQEVYQALLLYEDLSLFKPQNVQDFLQRGNAWRDLKKGDEAFADYDKALELDPQSAEVYKEKGVAYNERGEWAKALEAYEKALQLQPQFAEVYSNRGILKMQQELYKEAILDFNHALELNPSLIGVYNNRGNAKKALGDLDAALEDYSTAIRYQPHIPKMYINRGATWYEKKQWDKALEDYNHALLLNPEESVAYNNRGMAKREKGELAQALNDFDKAIQIDPQDEGAYHNRGIIKRMQGNLKGALADFNQALLLNPQHLEGWISRGLIKKLLKDYSGALDDQTQALQIDPQSAMAFGNRALIREILGDFKGALEDFNHALQLQPHFAEGYYSRGQLKRKHQDYPGALEDFEKATQLQGHFPRAYVLKAMVLQELGQRESAASHFKIALQQENSPQILQAYLEFFWNEALSSFQQKNWGSAEKALQEYLEKAPANHPQKQKAEALKQKIVELQKK